MWKWYQIITQQVHDYDADEEEEGEEEEVGHSGVNKVLII